MNLGAIKMLTEYARIKRFEHKLKKLNKTNPGIRTEEEFITQINKQTNENSSTNRI